MAKRKVKARKTVTPKKTASKSKARTTKKSKSKSIIRRSRGRSTRNIIQTPPPVTTPPFKTCAEPEVGDIGGFGDVDAFESHERLCGEKATEYCPTCSRNLCTSHYELLHRDHNTGGNPIHSRPMAS
ncbi:MAG TPA: hypothetical protein VE177_05035 [Candidatus Binatus sp.]|nr:hypothetical protein [Candidatus Binatus sp.]